MLGYEGLLGYEGIYCSFVDCDNTALEVIKPGLKIDTEGSAELEINAFSNVLDVVSFIVGIKPTGSPHFIFFSNFSVSYAFLGPLKNMFFK